MKKIVILNGSPRKNGNTAELIRAFTDGAQSAGHSVVQFDLHEMNIRACRGCECGGANAQHPCTQNDDMNKIYPAYLNCDIIVLASPMYYWNFSAQLKCGLDRLYAITELAGHIRKESVLLMAAGGSSEENFTPIRQMYQALSRNMGWTDRGWIYAGGNCDPGDILQHGEQLDAARRLGTSL